MISNFSFQQGTRDRPLVGVCQWRHQGLPFAYAVHRGQNIGSQATSETEDQDDLRKTYKALLVDNRLFGCDVMPFEESCLE